MHETLGRREDLILNQELACEAKLRREWDTKWDWEKSDLEEREC